MADIPRLANNSATIQGYNTGTPRKAGNSTFSDIPLGSFAPLAASPGDNVFGVSSAMPSGAAAAAPAMAPATPPSIDQVELGSEQWQQIKLAQAIEQLQRDYGALAARNGGTLNDPYWAKELSDAVEEQAASISAEAAGYRQTREEAAKDRSLTASEGASNRELESRLAAERLAAEREAAKDAERAAMWQGGAQLGLGLLTTPRGGSPASYVWNPGSPAVPEVWQNGVRVSEGRAAVPAGPQKVGGEDPRYLGGDLLRGFTESGTPTARYLAPSMVGSGIGAFAGGAKKGAWSSLSSGMLGGGVNTLLPGNSTSPWGNLMASSGMAYANPFSKKSWGKNTGGTLLKLGATGLGTALLRGL